MPEQEDGFTFVDKRRTAGDDAATEQAVDVDPVAEDAGEIPENMPVPDVWMLLQYALQLFAQQAWMAMGLVANPATGQVEVDLAQARVAIDTVGDLVGRLEGAPESALPANARRELRNVLNNLRLNFVNQRKANETPSSAE
jgi:hypothetical protein